MSKQEDINVWFWAEPNNFGDYLGHYIPAKLTDYNVKFTHLNSPVKKYVIVGSVLNSLLQHTANCTVWGAGIMTRSDVIPSNVKILAVRGKETQQRMKDCGLVPPDIIGDPALLLPKIYSPPKEKKYKLGIIPHFVDYSQICKEAEGVEGVRVINLQTTNIEQTIDEIASCEYTISSSLHGIITSHAYNIPCLWYKFSDKIYGDGIKFQDYFSSVSIPYYEAFRVTKETSSISSIVDIISSNNDINHINSFDIDSLYNSCPFLKTS